MTDAGGRQAHQAFARARPLELDLLDLERPSRLPCNCRFHLHGRDHTTATPQGFDRTLTPAAHAAAGRYLYLVVQMTTVPVPPEVDEGPSISQVIEILPDAVYENPTALGLAYFARDVGIYGLVVALLFFDYAARCSCRSG